MKTITNIADLTDPNDAEGRSYREVNNAIKHSFAAGELVELEYGVRLFITRLTRDCDGTPLYCLGPNSGRTVMTGYPESAIKAL